VIGPNAKFAAYSGGGSANLLPYHAITPFEAVSAQVSSTVEYTIGYGGYNKLPLLSNTVRNIKMYVYTQPSSDKSRKPIEEITVANTDVYLFDYHPPLPTSHKGAFYVQFVAEVQHEATGDYDFSLSVAGTARLYVDGELLVDAATTQEDGGSFYGFGTTEITAKQKLNQGVAYTVTVEFGSLATSLLPGPGADSTSGGGVRIGFTKVMDAEEEIQKAVEISKKVDQVVILTGLNVRPPIPLPQTMASLS
jgi:beta-glucosidase